jgi:WD40 repeat protein
LDLIATGGRDNKVNIWDYERLLNVGGEERNDDFGPSLAHTEPVTIVKFIKPFPLLITSDTGG